MEFNNRKKISVFEDIDDSYLQVRIRDDRKLEVSDKIIRPIWNGPGCLGDKFASSTSNLGTIGQMMNIKDMPYSGKDIPDLVVNTQ